nr:MAG TPA: hypothetical protein [Bacteriophage sp.]
MVRPKKVSKIIKPLQTLCLCGFSDFYKKWYVVFPIMNIDNY